MTMTHTRRIQWTLGALMAFAAACGPDGCGCEPPPQVGNGLTVAHAEARACDALFEVSGDEVPEVRFQAPVTGEFVPKAPRFAISFVANADASLEGQELARFVFTTTNDPPSLVESTCYDGAGNAIEGQPLRLAD
jgi:hypothetical protein